MENQLVRYSRAGDAFHYRWAARRCLRLIVPHSPLKCITIESSRERQVAGEYVIDLAEYSQADGEQMYADYFQLKHTTTRTNKAFALSEISSTLAGFAKRYSALLKKPQQSRVPSEVTFSLVTNRPIDQKLKDAVVANAQGVKADGRVQRGLEKATKLRGGRLRAFCASLKLVDAEGDYVVQKHRLKRQISEYIAGFVDSRDVEAIIALVADRALPESEEGNTSGEICQEDVLQRLGVTSLRDLLPSPPEFEALPRIIKREQHDELLRHIATAAAPMIIHAAGGVGKSVVARQLAESFAKGSQGFVYDCFGGGKYRNPSMPRHRAADALLQLGNEMAARGLCQSLIARGGISADGIFRAFLERLRQASDCLRDVAPKALLVLFVDAADNAELAANEYGDRCFAHELLREPLPPGCRLVMLCRTERIDLLKPASENVLFALRPFSESETAAHLRQRFADASDRHCVEFHRLTGGNPRVQANAFDHGKNVGEVLSQLGPGGKTVAAHISSQLASAISSVRDRHVNQTQVDAVCCGLATLPPFVPIDVLAKAAGVEASTVHSLISDLGRPLWQTENAVQFRDEPTETWFRDNFSANKSQIAAYLTALEPLATNHTYVAKVLPQLLLRNEEHDRLVKLALSNDFLPSDNAIDERDIRLYRLQFAFKAALKIGRFADAARLAFRAGEEVAGNGRQLLLLQRNLHLISPLQGAQRIQELAYRHAFSSGWQGSENLFSASLLSGEKAFHGEAQAYLRAAQKWIQAYFRERAKSAKKENARVFNEEALQDADIAEMSWAELNLYGTASTMKFFDGWRPPSFSFTAGRLLIRRLVDTARFDEIDEIARLGARNIYLMLAVTDELMNVAHFPPRDSLRRSLHLLAAKSTRISRPKEHAFQDEVRPAILSFLEACAARGISRNKIAAVLKYYFPVVAGWSVGSRAQSEERRTFIRGIALTAVLADRKEIDVISLLPPKDVRDGSAPLDEDARRDIVECISALLPWYMLRAQSLAGHKRVTKAQIDRATNLSATAINHRYRAYEPLPTEVARMRFDVLALSGAASTDEIKSFKDYLKAAEHYSLYHRLEAARAIFRLSHLDELREPVELSCRASCQGARNDGPDERADNFISLAIAVSPTSISDAAAYFNLAVEAVSKFGDELVERWEAVVEVARRASEDKSSIPETAYRFFRCAEMIGDTVAREKYWDRDAVFEVGVKLDATSAFACLSRWRDRRVGYFNEQLLALATTSVEAGILLPTAGWALSGFQGCNANVRLTSICIEREASNEFKQKILDLAVRDLELAGASLNQLKKLESVAVAAHLSRTALNRLIGICERAEQDFPGKHPASVANAGVQSDPPKRAIKEWFKGIDIFTAEGLAQGLNHVRKAESPFRFERFWKETLGRVPVGREIEFLKTLVSGAGLHKFDVFEALGQVRTKWLQKAAVKRAWPAFLKQVGTRLAISLSDRRSLLYFVNTTHLDEWEAAELTKGILGGLAESSELMGASTFFGFISLSTAQWGADDARALLDYALSRFEKHITDDYGDGVWSEWLKASLDARDAVVGLVWSALGSPYSATRWEAAHCVRRLAANGCTNEIALLVNRMSRGGVGAFGGRRFPFYELHAKLYLLISLARVALDDINILKPHADVFARIALDHVPHILLQQHATAIALAIHAVDPITYSKHTLAALRRVGASPFPEKLVDDYLYKTNSPWHTKGQIDLSLTTGFEYDIEKYWLSRVSRVFGLSEKQTIELARDTAAHNLQLSPSSYHDDPRRLQWNSINQYGSGYSTVHSHGSYPSVDSFDFYYSYHTCMATAARLLSSMPAVRHGEHAYEDNRWKEWLSSHLLSRADGKWLSDRRDPTPAQRRAWIGGEPHSHWEWEICANDFIEMLRQMSPLPGSLCVSGNWIECDNSREEVIQIASALVAPSHSDSTADALRRSEEVHLSELPWVGDEGSGISSKMTGWIRHGDERDPRIDRFDPYAKAIHYPPREVSVEFITLLELSPDPERREWRLPKATHPSLIAELWSDISLDDRDKPCRYGQRLNATTELLTKLCKRTKKDLLLEVRIERRRADRYSSNRANDLGHVPASRKFFVLSSKGTLRERKLRYQLT